MFRKYFFTVVIKGNQPYILNTVEASDKQFQVINIKKCV